MNRRRFLATSLATGLGAAGITPMTGAGSESETESGPEPQPQPPGVRHRHTYENLWITGTAAAHGDGRVLVGRAGPRPDPEDPVRVAVVDAAGEVQQRTAVTPELPREAHATPDVVRTDDGYAVAAGPWLARLDAELSVRSIGKHADVDASEGTTLVPVAGGFVSGFSVQLPNAFWTHFVGFDAEGRVRWHHEHNVDGSQELDFLVPDGDGGALAGGTFPWLAELGADGTVREVDLPGYLPSGVLNAGVRDGDGLVLCSGDELVRLDGDYAIDWTRTYDALFDRRVRELTATADGGFLFLTGGYSIEDALVCKTDASGELLWSHGYRIDSADDTRIQLLAEPSPGEYLVAGGYHLSTEGWAIRLSTDRTPTPTASPTPTEPSTPTPTPVSHVSATDVPTTEPPTESEPGTTTTVPGFGAVTGGLAIGGALVARALGGSDA